MKKIRHELYLSQTQFESILGYRHLIEPSSARPIRVFIEIEEPEKKIEISESEFMNICESIEGVSRLYFHSDKAHPFIKLKQKLFGKTE